MMDQSLCHLVGSIEWVGGTFRFGEVVNCLIGLDADERERKREIMLHLGNVASVIAGVKTKKIGASIYI